jgi:mRNA interferase MazF
MSYRTYIPKRGDILHMNFSPSAGHEFADRHYAIVISNSEYNRKSRMCIVCGITSRVHGWPFEVEVPSALLPPKKGAGVVKSVVVADAVRHIDFREREASLVASAPRQFVEEVLDALFAVCSD